MGRPQDSGDGKGSGPARREPPPAEWAVAALGLALVVATLGYLGWASLQGEQDAPDPRVEVVSVREQGDHFLVHLRVRNAGARTAAALRVTGVLREQGREVERSETEFDYLPGRSSRQAGLFFMHDPRRFELSVQPQAYQKP